MTPGQGMDTINWGGVRVGEGGKIEVEEWRSWMWHFHDEILGTIRANDGVTSDRTCHLPLVRLNGLQRH